MPNKIMEPCLFKKPICRNFLLFSDQLPGVSTHPHQNRNDLNHSHLHSFIVFPFHLSASILNAYPRHQHSVGYWWFKNIRKVRLQPWRSSHGRNRHTFVACSNAAWPGSKVGSGCTSRWMTFHALPQSETCIFHILWLLMKQQFSLQGFLGIII